MASLPALFMDGTFLRIENMFMKTSIKLGQNTLTHYQKLIPHPYSLTIFMQTYKVVTKLPRNCPL